MPLMARQKSFASLWMLVAGICFALMGTCVKLGASYFSSAELVFYRSLFGFMTIFIIIRVRHLEIATPNWKTHLSRSINGFVSLMLFFYAITKLPLATAMTLNYTSPLFLALFSTILLREKMIYKLYFAIFIGFVGVYILLNPTFHHGTLYAGVLGLISGLLAGYVYFQVTQLGRMGEPSWRTVFYFSLVCLLGSGVWVLIEGIKPIAATHLPLLIGMGAFATLAQLAMTRAYGSGHPLVAGSLAYSTVIFSSLLGLWIWNDELGSDQWIAIGLIIASGVLSVSTTRRQP